MVARTVKGTIFTIIVDGKRITVKHIAAKGKRCRVTGPEGVMIESSCSNSSEQKRSSMDPRNLNNPISDESN